MNPKSHGCSLSCLCKPRAVSVSSCPPPLPLARSNLHFPCEMPDSANSPLSAPASDLPAPRTRHRPRRRPEDGRGGVGERGCLIRVCSYSLIQGQGRERVWGNPGKGKPDEVTCHMCFLLLCLSLRAQYQQDLVVLQDKLRISNKKLEEYETRFKCQEETTQKLVLEYQARLEESEERLRRQQEDKEIQMKGIISRYREMGVLEMAVRQGSLAGVTAHPFLRRIRILWRCRQVSYMGFPLSVT